MYNRDRSAVETCLNLPEIVYQIGSYLYEPSALYDASRVNRLWNAALLPLRSRFPHVTLNHVSSFLSFLKSNRRASHYCRALRLICDDTDDDAEDDDGDDNDDPDFEPSSDIEMDGAREGVENNNNGNVVRRSKNRTPLELEPIVGILNHLVDNGKLQFFMYALPGEPFEPLPDNVWLVLRKMSNTLQGLYIELVRRHWDPFLSSRFSNLHYLRLFLDTDEQAQPGPDADAFDPKVALLTFLQSHPRLQVLHLYLGTCFTDLALSSVTLPSLRSFLLISKAENIDVAPFITNHNGLTSLDVYTDSEITPFAADKLPNIQALQVSAMTASWFHNILATASKRAQPISHLQITAARQENFEYVLHQVAPLGATLRCLELIFWSRDAPLVRVLEGVSRTFPKLVEISLFIPSWGSAEWEEEDKPLDLRSMLECFASNSDLLAFSVSDPKTELLDKAQIEAVPESSLPPRLQYIIWRSQTFRLKRRPMSNSGTPERVTILAERTYHPRNLRGSQYLRDWHEEMAFDHLAGDYEEQLKLL